jgi:ribosomal-protein-alanine acetyltransferase
MAADFVVRRGRAGDPVRMREILASAPEAAQCTEGYDVLVADHGGLAVGFAVYRLVAGEGELLNLAVDPGWRRLGVATALLDHMMPEASLWHLEVRESNRQAIDFYERRGFERVGERRGYYRDGETALLYSFFSGVD